MKFLPLKNHGVPGSSFARALSAALLVVAGAALAQSTNQIVFDLRTLIGGPATNRTVLITPMIAPTAVGQAIQIGDAVRFNSGSGTFVTTNMNPGLYRVEVQPPPRLTWFALELTNVTGWATASWYIVESPVPETTYPRSIIDSHFDSLNSIFTTYPAATNIAEFISSENISNTWPVGVVHVSALRGLSPGERNNPLKPFASLAEAHDAALPGDVVWVHDGAFNETVWVKPGVSFQLDDGVVIANPFGCSNSAAPVFIGGRGTFTTSPVTFYNVTNVSALIQCRLVTNTTAPALYAYTAGSVRVNLLADEIYAAQPSFGFGTASDITIICREAYFTSLGSFSPCVPRLYAQSVSFSGSSGNGATNTIFGAFINTTSAPIASGRLYLFNCASTNFAAPFYAAGKTFGTVHIYAP